MNDARQLNGAINSVRDDMQRYRRDANAGSASAIAMANLPQAVLPGEKVVSLAAGNYSGQSAMALWRVGRDAKVDGQRFGEYRRFWATAQ